MKVLQKMCTHSKLIQNILDPVHLRSSFSMTQSQWSVATDCCNLMVNEMLCRHEVERHDNRKDRVVEFLNILSNADSPWFKKFTVALTSCKKKDYSELAKTLEQGKFCVILTTNHCLVKNSS